MSARSDSISSNNPLHRLGKLAATLSQRGLRSSETAQIVASAILGIGVGVVVNILRRLVEWLHRVDFGLAPGGMLSRGEGIDPLRLLVVPALGGLLLGALTLLIKRYRSGDIVDPVEANALYGGRMSLIDSIRLTFDTLISNASGASLGMEAGYSQLGAGIYSSVAQYFRLRRADHRIFVTAGAAAAIAAAFNAPLAGIFYGFELVLGSYVPHAIASVTVAAVTATLVEQALGNTHPLFEASTSVQIESFSYALFAWIGVFSAGIAILAMTAVTWTEKTLRRIKVPGWLRPFVGGLCVSALALFFPQVLGSGHGAIQLTFDKGLAFLPLLALLAAKIAASAASVGSGFRGGLFSSSLYLGCLFGALFAQAAVAVAPGLVDQHDAFLMVGMGSVAAAIVGAPFTMVFLVLEATGNFPVTSGVLLGVIIAVTITRLTFGFSFSTWRFHQRGIGIKSAHDVGWIGDLTVARLMRNDPKLVSTRLSLKELREKYPPGSAKRVFALDPNGYYAGSVDIARIYDPELDETLDIAMVADVVERANDYLLPRENVKTALLRFDETETEALPVLAAGADARVIGYLTEAYALRRYTQEMERRRSAELGQQDLFSLKQGPR